MQNTYLKESRTGRQVITDWRTTLGAAEIGRRLGITQSHLRAVCSEKLAPIGKKYARAASKRTGLPYIVIRNLDEPIGKLVRETMAADRRAVRDAAKAEEAATA